MPSRFTHHSDEKTIMKKFGISKIDFDIWQAYNIKPTNTVICVYNKNQENVLEKFYWAKYTPRDVQKARGETVHQKSMFAKSFGSKRCILLAHGFFEWKQIKDGPRRKSIPYYFKLKNDEPFAVAGLFWDPWKDDEKDRNRMIIITVEANSKVNNVFHRMPAILFDEDIQTYLDTDTDVDTAQSLLKTYPEDLMEYYEVEELVSQGDRSSNTIVPKGQVKGGLDDFF